MEVFAGDNVIIKGVYTDEVEALRKHITNSMTSICDYFLYNPNNNIIRINVLNSKEELDELYKQLILNGEDKNLPSLSHLVAFDYEDMVFILEYDQYINVFQHEKTTLEEYLEDVMFYMVPIIQKWKFGHLSPNDVFNKGVAAYLAGIDIDTRVLTDSYMSLAKSGNLRQIGDFYRYLDNLLEKEDLFNLMNKEPDIDRMHKLYDGYKHQFFKSRGR